MGRFLRREIGFPDIPRLVAAALAQVPVQDDPQLADILAADAAADGPWRRKFSKEFSE